MCSILKSKFPKESFSDFNIWVLDLSESLFTLNDGVSFKKTLSRLFVLETILIFVLSPPKRCISPVDDANINGFGASKAKLGFAHL